MLDLIRRLIPEIGGPAYDDGLADDVAPDQKIAPGDILQLGPEVRIGHDWFEVRVGDSRALRSGFRQALLKTLLTSVPPKPTTIRSRSRDAMRSLPT